MEADFKNADGEIETCKLEFVEKEHEDAKITFDCPKYGKKTFQHPPINYYANIKVVIDDQGRRVIQY